MNRDEFFAELDQLTPKEIEARLPSWDKDKLALVREYLEQTRSKAPQIDHARDAAGAAAETASKANERATVAFMIAIGAMLAAIASTVVALLGLRYE